jgi:hypothetical protein
MAAKFNKGTMTWPTLQIVTDAVHYAITLENGTKNMFQEASWLARTGEIRTCVLMSMFAGCCAPRDRCSPDPIWRTSSTPLDQLELPKGATVWPLMWTVEQRLGFFQTNIVPKWEYFCVVTDMITTISHIQFCLDRWKQGCPASTTARSFSVTEQCLQCAKNAFENSSQVRISEACFAWQHSYCGDALSVKTSTHLRGTEWGGAHSYEGRVVGFTFRVLWNMNHKSLLPFS